MILHGMAEYRGLEKHQSKQGNIYYQLKFEDAETATQYQFYSRAEEKYTVLRDDLKKGSPYNLIFNYVYNSFDRAYRLELRDITE